MLNTPLGIGIDAGNASVKIAVCDLYGQIVYSDYQLHKSQVVHTFQFMLNKIPSEITAQIKYGSACGVFANLISESVENATESLIKGVQRIYPKAGCIAEIGSQTSQFIAGIKTGNIQFSSNKNCAAGTGSFFEDQMSRLGTKIEKYSEYVEKADRIPRLAGRCSVFAKTDIIHLQQDGEKIENILKGLAYSMVNNFRGTIIQTLPVDKPVFLAGGTSKNLGVVQAFKDVLKLEDEDLIVAEESSEIQAAGAASLAFEKRIKWNRGGRAFNDGEGDRARGDRAPCENALAPLIDDYPTEDLHKTVPMVAGEPLFLGIDVGSTSTNFVLINQKNQVVDYQYFKTLGNTSAAVQRGFDVLKERYGDSLNVINSGVTGSGRIMIGKKFNIPVVRDEITAQSTGTLFLNPECDTIFEIGGQDAKYISCKGGVTRDFAMNKVCSAGTGSFIEDQAERLGISAAELGMKALKSKKPALLDQRCTVFMKTSIENQLSQGDSLENVCAGLCYSVVRNYVHKVVANKPIGKKICFQGGLAYNHGIVAAFKSMFGDNFKITPYFSVTGALGMALLAKEAYEKVPENKIDEELAEMNRQIFENIQKTTFGKYKEDFSPEKKTIGIPRSLMIYKLFPFAYTYFTELGFNVVLSGKTCEETVQLSQTLVQEETCFPIKLMHAHMQELVEAGCDYIFMPSVYTMQHQLSNLKNNYGCVYMQTAARLVGDVLDLEKKGIKLLNPILQMDMGAPHMAVAMLKMGVLTLGKNPLKCKNALMKAGMALKQAQKKQEADGKQFLEKVAKEDKVLVLITRTYGLIDDVLNMGLPDLLLERGCKVITLGNLEGHCVDIAKNYDNLYWPFSQHILSGAKIIKENPNLYAVYLTNHGCGPDTMISHLFAEIMGEKPYLQIEVDEHYSKVGLITRIEAFLSNLEKNQNKVYTGQNPKLLVSKNLDDLEKTLPVYIPHYNFISDFVAEGLQTEGYNAKVLPPTSRETLTLGKDNTTSKEYVTFASLLGDVLKFAADNPKSDEEKQLLLFQTEGSETDGFYAQVIRSKLDQMGRTDIKIIAPKIEEMISADEKWFNIFWNAAKKTDVALNKQEITKNTGYSKILLTGEPLVMLNDACNSNFAEYFQSRNIKFGYSSLCEYLVFLWTDKINSKKTEDSKDGEKRLKLIKKDYPAVNDLQKIADKKFALLSGGNVRYRYAKHIAGQKNFGLVVEMDPMYENGTTILNMAHSHKIEKLPVFQIQFDGNPNADAMEQLEAFLKLSWGE